MSNTQPITINCPNCGEEFTAYKSEIGGATGIAGTCPHCGARIAVTVPQAVRQTTGPQETKWRRAY